jgi:hypothetical protein
MSKKDFLASARAPAEIVTLKGGQQIAIRKFTQGEMESILRATAKTDEKLRPMVMQLKLVALTVSIDDEQFTEEELRLSMDQEVLREIGEHVSRVNGLSRPAEEVEGG